MGDKWANLTGVELFPWQKEASEAWLSQKKGTMKVVTGVGKTICAMAIIQELQAQDPLLRVAIVVPSKVLVEQWKDELLDRLSLSHQEIGVLGAGRNDYFSDDVRILICVINSAAKKLPSLVGEELAKHLLLVVDECHRAGAASFSKIFNTPRAYSLGLSATPERETGIDYNSSMLGRELGPIVYEMNYAQAEEQGLLPSFQVLHFALPLTEVEAKEYQRISNQVTEMRRKLWARFEGEDKVFHPWVQNQAKGETGIGRLAQGYLASALKRKQLLYKAQARDGAVMEILKHTFQENPQAKVIMFHETIDQVEDIHRRLVNKGYSAVVEHSGLKKHERAKNIKEFRDGDVQIIVSARTLIEGFNVPKADVGLVVASSSSVRQRIQTLGRVLRKGDKGKEAVVYILYMHNTSDENVYQKADWEDVVGKERNSYYYWDLKNPPRRIDDPAPGIWGEDSEQEESPLAEPRKQSGQGEYNHKPDI